MEKRVYALYLYMIFGTVLFRNPPSLKSLMCRGKPYVKQMKEIVMQLVGQIIQSPLISPDTLIVGRVLFFAGSCLLIFDF